MENPNKPSWLKIYCNVCGHKLRNFANDVVACPMCFGDIYDPSIEELEEDNIVKACNSHVGMLKALEEIAEGKGVYSLDKLTHATNIVENLTTIAKQAIENTKEKSR